jgi:hypothetical protein
VSDLISRRNESRLIGRLQGAFRVTDEQRLQSSVGANNTNIRNPWFVPRTIQQGHATQGNTGIWSGQGNNFQIQNQAQFTRASVGPGTLDLLASFDVETSDFGWSQSNATRCPVEAMRWTTWAPAAPRRTRPRLTLVPARARSSRTSAARTTTSPTVTSSRSPAARTARAASAPRTSGRSSPPSRSGGGSLGLTTLNFDNGRFSWRSAFNVAANRNKVLALPDGIERMLFGARGGWAMGTHTHIVEVGKPLGNFYGYNVLGIFQQGMQCHLEAPRTGEQLDCVPGEMIIEDVNGDGKIDDLDRTVVGNADPKFYGGMTKSLAFGRFSMEAFMSYSYGNEVLNASNTYQMLGAGTLNERAEMLNRWTPTNTNLYEPTPRTWWRRRRLPQPGIAMMNPGVTPRNGLSVPPVARAGRPKGQRHHAGRLRSTRLRRPSTDETLDLAVGPH